MHERNCVQTTPLAVLFDLDGTLLDTVQDLADAVNLMLSDMGRPVRSLSQIHTFIGKGIPNLVSRSMTEDAAATAAEIEQALVLFHRHYAEVNGRKTEIYPGVLEALNDLHGWGIQMGVVTNKSFNFAQSLLERKGLSHYFGVLLGGDSLSEKKPSPLPLISACHELGVSASQTVMFGDSENDALAAQAAGMPIYLLTYGYSEGHPLDTIACNGLVSRITDAWPELSLPPRS